MARNRDIRVYKVSVQAWNYRIPRGWCNLDTDRRKVLQGFAETTPPSHFYSVKDFFKSLYHAMKATQKNYSYRQLSLDLGFSETNLFHLISTGKRPVTEEVTEMVISVLRFRPIERKYFQALARLSREKKADEVSKAYKEVLELKKSMLTEMDQDHFAYYSEWYIVVLRELVALDEFQADAKWIAANIRPAISLRQAEHALAVLKKLDLIRFDELTGLWCQTQRVLSTGSEVLSLSVRKYHQESIPQALEALVNVPQSERHISGLVLSLNQDQFGKVKAEIEAFQARLLQIEGMREATKPDRIVTLNMQLFPSFQK